MSRGYLTDNSNPEIQAPKTSGVQVIGR
jgi:hypothetical protein